MMREPSRKGRPGGRPERRQPPPGPRPRPAAQGGEDLVYGRNAVLEAARAGRLRRVLLSQRVAPDPRLEELRRLVQVEEVAPERLDALAGGVHQGVIGRLKPRSYLTLRQLLAMRPTLLVALDGVEDPQNLGAILRSAEAAGADGAILPERRSAPVTSVAVKASSGASEILPLCRVAGLASVVSELTRSGIWCVALDPRAELAPWDFDFTQPVCLVVGGEGGGVHRLVRERCEAAVRLPMRGRVASFNASAAAAAALYEITRQRTQPSGATTLDAHMQPDSSPQVEGKT
jgi:23S rRNA (guanosine2251-2'-O)-methyltransferase